MTKTNNLTRWVMLASAVSLTAACASRDRDVPPGPVTGDAIPTQAGDPYGTQNGPVAGAVVPGSRADFLQSVPSDRVYFGFDSYALDSESRSVLDSQAQWLLRNSDVNVTVEGHADERGTREYNLALGDRRANAAKAYLEQRGVAARRMQTLSWGKERPAVEGSNEAAWAQNRRAVTVVPQ